MSEFTIHHGDALAVLRGMPDNSIDAIVTDPPYGLGKEPNAAEVLTDWVTKGFHEVKASGGFMGKKWDSFVPQPLLWKEVFRVLKPGGHLLSFAGTRTYDWMVMSLRLADFEIRDMVNWVYGSGFPKSLDVSKAIDKMHGAEREREPDPKSRGIARSVYAQDEWTKANHGTRLKDGALTEAAKQWDGFGTALKPAHEPIVLARKPISESSIAANVLRWGTGAVNVDGCRIGTSADMNPRDFDDARRKSPKFSGKYNGGNIGQYRNLKGKAPQGRFPANLITDGSAEVVAMFPVTTSGCLNNGHKQGAGSFGKIGGEKILRNYGGDTGSAARFFKACPPDDAASLVYCAKASRSERDAGLGGMPKKACGMMEDDNYDIKTGSGNLRDTKGRNHHPTVKPQSLMRYLCRLITPPSGIILDPFFGSGSTGVAAITEGFSIIGIEQDAEFAEIARRRCEHARQSHAATLFEGL